MNRNSKERFYNRVEDYVKYRPGYPGSVINWLEKEFHLGPGCLVADIGSGTGISSRLFLEAGYKVLGIEPNRSMREKSIDLLKDFSLFQAIDGSAESTGLPENSVDMIVAGQAFHWFNQQQCRIEFTRILRPGGIAAIIWNERLVSSAFAKEYDQFIIRHATDYLQVDHRNISQQSLELFYQPFECKRVSFPNEQVFDFEGLKGRLLSSSYIPAEGQPVYGPMIDELKKLFNLYNDQGKIRIEYLTKVFSGLLKEGLSDNFLSET